MHKRLPSTLRLLTPHEEKKKSKWCLVAQTLQYTEKKHRHNRMKKVRQLCILSQRKTSMKTVETDDTSAVYSLRASAILFSWTPTHARATGQKSTPDFSTGRNTPCPKQRVKPMKFIQDILPTSFQRIHRQWPNHSIHSFYSYWLADIKVTCIGAVTEPQTELRSMTPYRLNHLMPNKCFF